MPKFGELGSIPQSWVTNTLAIRRWELRLENNPMVLLRWSHVIGLKEAPLQNLISAIFAET